MADVATTVHHMAHDAHGLDRFVVIEIKAQMAREAATRAAEGLEHSRFTLNELADLTAGMSVDQVGRRLRGETEFTLDDLEVIAEALGIEPFALLKAALMRKRKALGTAPKRLRDQVIEGPAGLPTIQ